MFPLPLQLFRPFSLENSQWHPVRFASWFICHISFISLNSLYLSSGSMHLSWAPQQCLQARSKHILHVTLQLQLHHFTLGVWSQWKIYCLVSLIFFSFPSFPHTTKFLALSVSGVATSQAASPHISPSFFLCFVVNFENCKRSISVTWKGCFVEDDEWLTQLGEYGNGMSMVPTGQVKTNLFMNRF